MNMRRLTLGLLLSSVTFCGCPAAHRHQVQPCRSGQRPRAMLPEYFKKKAEGDQGSREGRGLSNSTLYKDKEEMEALQIGAVQMLAPSLAKFGPLG